MFSLRIVCSNNSKFSLNQISNPFSSLLVVFLSITERSNLLVPLVLTVLLQEQYLLLRFYHFSQLPQSVGRDDPPQRPSILRQSGFPWSAIFLAIYQGIFAPHCQAKVIVLLFSLSCLSRDLLIACSLILSWSTLTTLHGREFGTACFP